MHSGHSDAVLQPHQLRQHLGALDDRDLSRPGFQHFGIGGGNCRTRHHYVARRRVPGCVSLVDHRPHARQPVRHRRPPQVRPRHRVAHSQQNLRNPAHANAANADEVDAVRWGEQEMTRRKHAEQSLLGALALFLYRTRTSLYQPSPAPPALELWAKAAHSIGQGPSGAKIISFPQSRSGARRSHTAPYAQGPQSCDSPIIAGWTPVKPEERLYPIHPPQQSEWMGYSAPSGLAISPLTNEINSIP